jgi:predicted cupin superfamily sugar epimerase
MDPRAAEIIRMLELTPHREGGFFREVFRSPRGVMPDDGRARRSAVTTIFFLLVEGQVSRWHAVGSDEVWHLYEGRGVEIFVGSPDLDRVERRTLRAVDGGEWPTLTVPTGAWQAARPLGPYALSGCTVAPGFDYEDFRLMSDDAAVARKLALVAPDLVNLV